VDLYDAKIEVLRSILLEQAYFGDLEKNPLLLKMFRDLFLDPSFGFDAAELINEKSEDGRHQFVWFFATMLNFKHLVSLSNLLELKR
jgi:hypothetical protein